MRLISKAFRIQGGGIAANVAPNQTDGSQVSFHPFEDFDVDCVPFQGGTPLPDRKVLVITCPLDTVNIGGNGVIRTNGYRTRGAGREIGYTGNPNVDEYSNRAQFLRGQYTCLRLTGNVDVCCQDTSFGENIVALELS